MPGGTGLGEKITFCTGAWSSSSCGAAWRVRDARTDIGLQRRAREHRLDDLAHARRRRVIERPRRAVRHRHAQRAHAALGPKRDLGERMRGQLARGERVAFDERREVDGRLGPRTAAGREHQVIGDAHLRHVELAARVELKRRLGENSSNSSKPPSSDSPADRHARPKDAPRGNPRGGQRGHQGHKRTFLPANRVRSSTDCFPPQCRRCGAATRCRSGETQIRFDIRSSTSRRSSRPPTTTGCTA